MAEIELFTKPGCGWAERNYAALIEKGVPFRTVMSCDSSGYATADFRSVSPYGRTPALRFGVDKVWESSIMNDYIDDLVPEPPLRPAEAMQRAEGRLWIYHCDAVMIPALSALARLGAEDAPSDTLKHSQALLAGWWVARPGPGPLWGGDRLSLVDIAFHTLFQTWAIVDGMSDTSVPSLDAPLIEWKAAIARHPSIKAAGEIGRSIANADTVHA